MLSTIIRATLPPIAAVVFCFATAAAQQSSGTQPSMDIRFSVFSLDNDIAGMKYLRGSAATSIVAPSSYKPIPVHYAGPYPLVLFRETKDSANKPVRHVLAEVRPPQPTGSYLVVLKRISSSPERYATMVVPDDKMKATSSWQFINLTPVNVALVFSHSPNEGDPPTKAAGPFQLLVPPGKSEILDLGTTAGYFEGKSYILANRAWKLGHSTRYYFEPRRPRTFFISQDPPNSGSLSLKIVFNALARTEPTNSTPGRTPQRR
jgi:hypothetical protein